MNYDSYYYYGEEALEAMMPVLSGLIAVMLTVFAVTLLLGAVLYVIRALALYTMAKRRGLKNSWLSWIPVGQEWIIGSVSDQYKYLTQGKNQSRRKILLILELAALVLGFASVGLTVTNSVRLAMEVYQGGVENAVVEAIPMMGAMVLGIVSFAVGVTGYVFRQMSMYDLYRSCDPKNAVPYLVFGILLSITEPFFLIFLRNKDGGMPPRRENAPVPDVNSDL